MQLTLFTTTLALLAWGTLAAPAAILPRQGIANPRLAQFRVFSAPGCSAQNQGFYTIETDQANSCYNLQADATKVSSAGYQSIVLQVATANSTAANCKLLLYSDAACNNDETEASLNVCKNADTPAVQPNWNSYLYKCDTSETTAAYTTA